MPGGDTISDYTSAITLLTVTWEPDENGVERPSEKRTTVLCAVKSAGQNEFFSAQTTGFKAAYVFEVHPIEYDGQTDVEFEGEKYSIYRTYKIDNDRLELHAQSTIGGLMKTIDEWANQEGIEFIDYSGFPNDPNLLSRQMSEGDFKAGMVRSRVRKKERD